MEKSKGVQSGVSKAAKQQKNENYSALLKIPDNAIISELKTENAKLNMEIGQLKSYILELEHKIHETEVLNKGIVNNYNRYKDFYKNAKKEAMKDDIFSELKNIIEGHKKKNGLLHKENKNLKDANNSLLSTVVKLRKQGFTAFFVCIQLWHHIHNVFY